jgi:hypothetical protein
MKTLRPEKPAWPAAGLRIIFLVIIVLLLLPALAPRESAWPSGGAPTSLMGASEVSPDNLTPPGLRSAALNRENTGRSLASLPAPGISPDITVRPASLGRLPRHCPLPPASAFPLQTNLRQYLETWPTPGATTAEAWPEYIPEEGEELD